MRRLALLGQARSFVVLCWVRSTDNLATIGYRRSRTITIRILHYVNKKPESVIRSLEAARAFLHRYWDSDRAYDCTHGHDCSSDR